MFRKVKMSREDEEWVIELAGREIPMIAVKSFVTTLFICVLVYWTYMIAYYDSLATDCNKKIDKANQQLVACTKAAATTGPSTSFNFTASSTN